MASPSADEFAAEQPKKITFRFCRECANMLYAKEDKITNTLMFACRTCQFSEPATSSCVFRNELSNTVGETAGITQDVGSDPTVGDPSSLPLPLCTMCGQEILCELCGEAESETGFFLEILEEDPNETTIFDEDDPMSEDDDDHGYYNSTAETPSSSKN